MNKRGFTLIELLVVVAIIALLISILLPSIESARAQAQATVCTSKLHDIFSAQNNYAYQFSDWVPGSPGTTGQELSVLSGSEFPPQALDTPGVPVQTWDWQTPLLHYGLDETDLPRERNDRWRHLREHPLFTCPSNNFVTPPYPIDTINDGWPVMRMNSYSTIREFMYFGYTERGGLSGVNIPPGWDVKTPEGHVPRFTNIQRSSQKAFIVEGSRYLHANEPSPDYDVNFRGTAGGSFATSGPSNSFSRAFINPVILDQQRHDPKWDRFSYRHPVAGAPGFNVLFFDGHAERLSKDVAIESVDFWLPTGTKVLVTEYDGSIPSGNAPTPKPRAVHMITKREQDQENFYPIY